MIKKIFFAALFGFLLISFANSATAQQSISTISGETITYGADLTSGTIGDATDMCEVTDDDSVVVSNNGQAARPPAGACLLMECWMTCNVPGMGNTYESALQCNGTTQSSLRTSCTLAGGSVTLLHCRARGWSTSRCAPPTSPPVVIPGPLPW